jgi:predicted O-methyltransferase YrrM
MSNRMLGMTDRIYDYMLGVSVHETDVQVRLRAETANMPLGGMQISPDHGQFMHLLARIIGARNCLEIGTFTGYSAICVASALPDDGRLICCDINEETTAVAQRYWAEAGLADKIDLRLGAAQETLQELLDDGGAGSFDFAFIDADKTNYATYYEQCLKLLRSGGVIAVDNVLWSGSVADPERHTPDTDALRAFNRQLHDDKRVDMAMLAIGDGVTLARKR